MLYALNYSKIPYKYRLGCEWRCDPAYEYPVIRQSHTTHCKKGNNNWKFGYSNQVVLQQLSKTLKSFGCSESPKIKQLKEEGKFHLDRSRTLHLQNTKIRKTNWVYQKTSTSSIVWTCSNFPTSNNNVFCKTIPSNRNKRIVIHMTVIKFDYSN